MFKRVGKSLFLSRKAVLWISLGTATVISSASALPPEENIRQVTKNPANDYHVRWSPDGKRIAFSSNRAGNTDIWVKDVKEVFPVLSGPYLGQKPPGTTPEIFAPGIVSSAEFIDFKGAFSPDGREYYFYRHALPETLPVLLFTRIENGAWTKPASLPIAQGASTYHPCVSLDNKWLFFYWQFQPEQNRPTGFYASARTDAGWSPPRYAGQGMYLTCDNSGRFYTTESVWGDQPKHHLASMTFSQGRFSRPERLALQPHYENQTHPCIAPDGSYILFDINVENGSLFVNFKDKNGDWGEGIDLTKHGFKPDSRGAYISPDGKYLFFSVDGDIWWVDIQVIEKLRTVETIRADHKNTIDSSRSQLLMSAAEIIGSWGKAANLSQILESERNIAASLSPDGKYLFFRAESDIYWVSAKILDDLRAKALGGPEKRKARGGTTEGIRSGLAPEYRIRIRDFRRNWPDSCCFLERV
jgi:WD40-like Beta Propeller Repeat